MSGPPAILADLSMFLHCLHPSYAFQALYAAITFPARPSHFPAYAAFIERTLLGDDLDGIHTGIVTDGLEGEDEFAQCVRLQSVKLYP